ncbi:MAG: SOS response-associated peptidase family protein [Phycisphaerae bacterium]
MCGRITLRTPAAQLIEMFLCPSMPELAPRYNIAPTQLVICIRSVRDQPLQREAVFIRCAVEAAHLLLFWNNNR